MSTGENSESAVPMTQAALTRARVTAAMVALVLVASACSGGTERPSAATPTTETASAVVATEPPPTSETISQEQRESAVTADAGDDAGDGKGAAADDDSRTSAEDEGTGVQPEPADAEGHDTEREALTPEELEALRTAFNPLMPGGGVLSGHGKYWCALTSEGRIVCWATPSGGERVGELAEMPSGIHLAIGVGGELVCAIRIDKSLACWGTGHYSAYQVPTPDGEFTSVTVGNRDACAIRIDATVACWNRYGVSELVPTGEFASIAAREQRICGVRTDGDLVCWGIIVDSAQIHPADGKFISVAGSCAIRTDRALACWDRTYDRDNLRINRSSSASATRTPYGQFLSVSATGNYGCAVALDGELVCWGHWARLRRTPQVLSDQYIAAAVTTHGACGLTVGGHLRCLGVYPSVGATFGPGREAGHLGSHLDSAHWSWLGATFGPGREAVQLPGYDTAGFADETGEPSTRARRIGMGDDFMCMLQADSTIRCLGTFLQWYHETDEVIDAVAPLGKFVSVVAGPNHACALRLERTVVCWGPSSQERDPRWGDPLGPGTVPSGTFAVLAAGGSHTCGLRDDRSVECWINGEGRLLDAPAGAYVDIAAGSEHTCGLREDGVVDCWRIFGEYETWQHSAPDGHYIKLISEADHYCGIRDDYRFTCWWGDGTMSHSRGDAHPKRAFTTFADVALGDGHICGLRPGNSIVCMDRYGTEYMHPPEGEFFEIYSGKDASCAVDAQGGVTCWDDLASMTWHPFEIGESRSTPSSTP